MVKRGAKASDPLSTVVIFDQNLMDNEQNLFSAIIGQLQEKFDKDQNVKTSSKFLAIPNSVQWITPKTDEIGDKIPNEWQYENFVLVILTSSFFCDSIRSAFEKDRGLHNLLTSLLSGRQIDENKRVKIIVYEDGRRKQSRKGHLELELKRLEEEKMFEWITKVQVIDGVEVNLHPMAPGDLGDEIVRATKSVLDLSSTVKEVFISGSGANSDVWIPKKGGPPVSVSTTGGQNVGLLLLWQRYLMTISKSIGVEHAKVISSDENFNSPTQCFTTYDRCTTAKEGEEFLNKSCIVRPTGSARDLLALRGSRPNIGLETSKKVYKVMNSRNGDEKL